MAKALDVSPADLGHPHPAGRLLSGREAPARPPPFERELERLEAALQVLRPDVPRREGQETGAIRPAVGLQVLPQPPGVLPALHPAARRAQPGLARVAAADVPTACLPVLGLDLLRVLPPVWVQPAAAELLGLGRGASVAALGQDLADLLDPRALLGILVLSI